jgi:hypothetical protein
MGGVFQPPAHVDQRPQGHELCNNLIRVKVFQGPRSQPDGHRHCRLSWQTFQGSLPAHIEAGQDVVEVVAVNVEEPSIDQRTGLALRPIVRSAVEIAQHHDNKWPNVSRGLPGSWLLGSVDIRGQLYL